MASTAFFIRLAFAALTLNLVYGQDSPPLPTLDLNEWWGADNQTSVEDTSIKDFKIVFNDTMIDDLKYRLKNHRQFTTPLRGVAFNYGFNSNAMGFWVKYLTEQYPFKQREQFLNQYPHFTTKIQGLNIHFMRIRSQNTNNKTLVPLLLIHGWPGSIREFYESIPYLLSVGEAKGLALDIIAPSLPGFAFSEGAVRPNLGADKMAIIIRNLMHRLGYSEYYIQAGDVGSGVASNMATFFPNEVKGFHTNFPFFYTLETIMELLLGTSHPERVAKPAVVNRIYPFWSFVSRFIEFSGYIHIQATKPDTVGIALNDSPSGLISYTLEKISDVLRKDFINRTDGGLTDVLSAEQIMDNFVIYWSTNCITTSMRMYAEGFNKRYQGLELSGIVSPVPAWVLQAPDEIIYLPPWLIKKKFPNLLHETLPSVGGHFFAWEKPQEYAEDVILAINTFKKWHQKNATTAESCTNSVDEL